MVAGVSGGDLLGNWDVHFALFDRVILANVRLNVNLTVI